MTPKAELTITLTHDGRITLRGPIQDKMLCYGLLGCARDAIDEFGRQQQASPIIQPSRDRDMALSFEQPLRAQ